MRLRLRQAQADAGDIALLYVDESEALTHPYLAHAWAEKSADLRVGAPCQARKVAMSGEPFGSTLGALDAVTHELLVHTSSTKVSADLIGLLELLEWRYSPKPGCTRRPVVLVLDNGPVHTSRASTAALAARPWNAVEWLPAYAPELSRIERTWRDLKRHHLTHKTFKTAGDLECAIRTAVKKLNQERQVPHPCNDLKGLLSGGVAEMEQRRLTASSAA